MSRLESNVQRKQEQLRDELHVRWGFVNVSEEQLNNFLTPEEQRDFALMGKLKLMADGTTFDRLWAFNVGDFISTESFKQRVTTPQAQGVKEDDGE